MHQGSRGMDRGFQRDQDYSKSSRIQFLASEIPKIYTTQLKGSRFNYNRQALDPIPVEGSVTSWDEKDGFGFIEPKVDLSKIRGYSGKIFLHKNDVNYDVMVGDEVSFLLYSDSKGIGAHSCVQLGDEKARIDQVLPSQKVIPMAIPNKLLGALIGKKGQYINEITETYNVELSIHSNPQQRQANALQLVTVSGEECDLKEACKAICDRMTKGSLKQYNSKMLFLIPSEQTGRFIGNKGIHIRKAVQSEPKVSLTISKNSVYFKNTVWQKVILFGPADNVQRCIGEVVNQMCMLFDNVVEDYICGRKRVVKNEAVRASPTGYERERIPSRKMSTDRPARDAPRATISEDDKEWNMDLQEAQE